MQPIQVTFRNMPHSDGVEAYVRERAAKLETFFPRITGCHVAVEAPHGHQHGGAFRVRIDLVVPGAEIVVGHTPEEAHASEDAHAAIDHAFDQAGRRLEEYVRKMRGDVKTHEHPYSEGHVAKLWTYEGYGFIESSESGEVYFHRNSVLNHGFDRMKIGSKVRYIEEAGEKGPQASTVTVVG